MNLNFKKRKLKLYGVYHYEVIKMTELKQLLFELQQLYLHQQRFTEDWELLGFRIIERELLQQILLSEEIRLVD